MKAVVIIILAVGFLACGLRATKDVDVVEDRLYCDMVQQHKESGGEVGWPDYKGIYDTECGHEK